MDSLLKQIFSGARLGNQTIERLEIGKPGTPPMLVAYNGKIYVYNTQGQTLIDAGYISARAFEVGSITAEKVAFSNKKFVHNLKWTVVDAKTVSWTAGTIRFADGTYVAINAGSTGTLTTERWYLYYNGSSTLQKTKYYNTAIGGNNILLAVLQPTNDPDGKCVINTFVSVGTTIDGDLITTGRIQAVNGKTYFDLNANTFVIHDGVKTRLVIGKLGEGSYGIKLSLFSYDAIEDTDVNHFALWAASDDATDNVLIKEKTRGSVSVNNSSSQNVAHGLDYVPFVLVFCEETAGKYVKTFGSPIDGRGLYYEIDDTNLTLYNSSGGTKTFKYYIFYDLMTT